MDNFDYQAYLKNNPLLKEDARTDAEQEGYKDGFDDAKADIKNSLSKMKVSEFKEKIRTEILSTLSEESINEMSSEKEALRAKLEKLQSAFSSGKITRDKFLDTFAPLYTKFKSLSESTDGMSSEEKDIYDKIEKLRVASNAGKITQDEFFDAFLPLQKRLKGLKESTLEESEKIYYYGADGRCYRADDEGNRDVVSDSYCRQYAGQGVREESQYEASLYSEAEIDEEVERFLKEAETDVNVKDGEEDVNVDVEGDKINIKDKGVDATVEVGLSKEEKIVQDSLQAAMEAANSLGNQKLADQIGNTITFFTREYVVGRNSD